MFLPTLDGEGRLIEVRGVRTWSEGWADALRVRYITDARTDHTGGLTWHRDGTLNRDRRAG
jgi:hypothetical protein